MKNKTKLLLFTTIILISVGCENATGPEDVENRVFISDVRLPIDDNGYYHMTLFEDNWQTLHRISGFIVEVENSDTMCVYGAYVRWSSSHYWMLGDTLGYIVNRGLTDDLIYVSYDTTYITGFDGMEVPTINSSSRSNSSGEVNTMFAPVGNMRGDTVDVSVSWILNNEWETYIFEIVLD